MTTTRPRTRHHRRPGRWIAGAIAVSALAMVSACGGGGDSARGDGESSADIDPSKSGTLWIATGISDKLIGIDLETMTVEHTIEDLDSPQTVTYGAGYVWAYGLGGVLKVDPASGEATTIPIRDVAGLTVMGEEVWVSTPDGVAQLDLDNNQLGDPFEVPFDGVAHDLISHDQVIFGCDNTYGGVVQIDTHYDQVFANDWTKLGRRTCTQVQVANDTLYVAAEKEIQSHDLGDVDLIDRYVSPETIPSFVPLPDGKSLAVADQSGSVRRLDLESGEYGDPVSVVPNYNSWPKLTTDGEQVWAGVTDGKVLRLNPDTLVIEEEMTLPDNLSPAGLTLAP